MEDYIQYYTTKFSKDLKIFYDFDLSSDNTYPFVVSMKSDAYCNKKRIHIKWKNQHHFNMFSVSVFFTSLGAQIIGHLYSWESMEDFHRASQWPMLSCGMGGILPSICILQDSGLLPSDYSGLPDGPKTDDYLDVAHQAKDYLVNDYVCFFSHNSPNLNQNAYQRLQSQIVAEDLRAEMEKQWRLFENEIKGIHVTCKEYGFFDSGLYIQYPKNY